MSYSSANDKVSKPQRRISKKPQRCPNVLFEKWLLDLYTSAAPESKMRHLYSRALNSLRKHPLKLYSGKECIILQHFGKKLCGILDEKLQAHLKNGGKIQDLHHDQTLSKCRSKDQNPRLKDREALDHGSQSTSAQERPRREYIPAPRSGSYAILTTLHQVTLSIGHKGYMTKAELIDRAQCACDASFIKPSDPKTHYTAWKSMGVLINKNLVLKEGNPAKYSLTREGIELANKLVNVTLTGNQTVDASESDIRSSIRPKDRHRNCAERSISGDIDFDIESAERPRKRKMIKTPSKRGLNVLESDKNFSCRVVDNDSGKTGKIVGSGDEKEEITLSDSDSVCMGEDSSLNSKEGFVESQTILKFKPKQWSGIQFGQHSSVLKNKEAKTLRSDDLPLETNFSEVFEKPINSVVDIKLSENERGPVSPLTTGKITVISSPSKLNEKRSVRAKDGSSYSEINVAGVSGKPMKLAVDVELPESDNELITSLNVDNCSYNIQRDENFHMLNDTKSCCSTEELSDLEILSTPSSQYFEEINKASNSGNCPVMQDALRKFSCGAEKINGEEMLKSDIFSEEILVEQVNLGCLSDTSPNKICCGLRLPKSGVSNNEQNIPLLNKNCIFGRSKKENTEVKTVKVVERNPSGSISSQTLDRASANNRQNNSVCSFFASEATDNENHSDLEVLEFETFPNGNKDRQNRFPHRSKKKKMKAEKTKPEEGHSSDNSRHSSYDPDKMGRNSLIHSTSLNKTFDGEILPDTEILDSRASSTVNKGWQNSSRRKSEEGKTIPGSAKSEEELNSIDSRPLSPASLPDIPDITSFPNNPDGVSLLSVRVKKPTLQYVYLTPEGRDTCLKDQAEVLFDDSDLFLGYGCLCVKKDLLESGKKYRNLIDRSGGLVKVFLNDRDCDELSPCASQAFLLPIVPRVTTSQTSIEPLSSTKVVRAISKSPAKKKINSTINSVDYQCDEFIAPKLKASHQIASSQSTPSNICLSSASTFSELSREATVSDLTIEKVNLRPGDFKVYLLVDTGETSGSFGKSNQKVLTLDELRKQDVPFEVRRLNVGDYLWVARSNSDPSKELVLPFVIERKRLDDLASSIKDGRYREQKFRLKRCGLQNLIYLVEEYGNRQHLGLPESSIIQSIVNTYVIDGFHIRWTKTTTESINYVRRVTSLLTQKFSVKNLMSSTYVEECSNLSHESYQVLMTFDEFNKQSNKRKALSVSETFGKQLMQLHGLSDKKAAGILSLFPTPHSLFEAYKLCSTEQEKIELLSGSKSNRTGISAKISKSIYLLFNKENSKST
ncbi:uncharacterized protein LOC136038591 isoform X2 [Artemia franciscana]